MEQIVTSIFTGVLIYIFIGLLFSFIFMFKGIIKIDEDAIGTNIFFKLLIWPGVIIFWPLLLFKWIKAFKK